MFAVLNAADEIFICTLELLPGIRAKTIGDTSLNISKLIYHVFRIINLTLWLKEKNTVVQLPENNTLPKCHVKW